MKIELNQDVNFVKAIKQALKENNGYCPCVIGISPETKCMCKDFKDNVPAGEYCHCGLYKKISQ